MATSLNICGLQLAGHVPGFLPAHGGVEGEDQPSPTRGFLCFFSKKAVNF